MEKLEKFDFPEGEIISQKYKILNRLGSGYEGEVYKVEEIVTGIVHAAKFFLPERNKNNLTAKRYAKKLHKLRKCDVLIKYYTQETMDHHGHQVTYLISEYVEGITLTEFMNNFKGKKIPAYHGLYLLHALVKGLEEVHVFKEYHGDLHTDNVIIQKYGVGFDVKLLDMFHWGNPKPQDFRDDLCDVIKLFHEFIGGAKAYSSHPPEVKEICCGLKKNLIVKKFRNMSHLRIYLEKLTWNNFK